MMIINLKSNQRYDEILKLDPETGVTRTASRTSEHEPCRFKGHFAWVESKLLCLYKWDEKLIFRRDGDLFEIPGDAIATIQELGASNLLRVVVGNTEVFRWTYERPKTDFIDGLRYMVDEDHDFGLFVHNVINEKDRRNRIYC